MRKVSNFEWSKTPAPFDTLHRAARIWRNLGKPLPRQRFPQSRPTNIQGLDGKQQARRQFSSERSLPDGGHHNAGSRIRPARRRRRICAPAHTCNGAGANSASDRMECACAHARNPTEACSTSVRELAAAPSQPMKPTICILSGFICLYSLLSQPRRATC